MKRKITLALIGPLAIVWSAWVRTDVRPVHAQQPAHAWNCFPEATLTDDAYWLHQPPAVQQLRDIQDPGQLATTAAELAKQGYTIDVRIMVDRMDPVCTMGIRQVEGYTWVPSALQPPIYLPPGLTFPGLTPYDPDNPPPGSIKVSTNIADYPPAIAPAPVPSNTNLPKVGVCFSNNTICAVGPGGYGSKDGDVVTQDGKQYRAHVSVGLMGQTIWFEPVH